MTKWACRKHAQQGVPGAWADRVLYRPDPPASVITQRPPLALDPRSAFGQTNETWMPRMPGKRTPRPAGSR